MTRKKPRRQAGQGRTSQGRTSQGRTDTDATEDQSLSPAERAELEALRREHRQLREDQEILKRALAFFGKDKPQ